MGPSARLAPPSELSEEEARVFRQVVASVPANQFQPDDLHFLCGYARAAVMERVIAGRLAAEAATASQPRWAGAYASVTKTLLSFGARLRLGPLARVSHNRRSPGKPGAGLPSYYELMDLQDGDADAESGSRGAAAGNSW
jgi:hypothetical protein